MAVMSRKSFRLAAASMVTISPNSFAAAAAFQQVPHHSQSHHRLHRRHRHYQPSFFKSLQTGYNDGHCTTQSTNTISFMSSGGDTISGASSSIKRSVTSSSSSSTVLNESSMVEMTISDSIATGQVLSFLSETISDTENSAKTDGNDVNPKFGTASGFAVVRVCEDDVGVSPPSSSSSESFAPMMSMGAVSGDIEQDKTLKEEEEKVELANALFGNPTPPKPDQGVIADGDLTGRIVTFQEGVTGMVVAHRHPIAFVLINSGMNPLESPITKSSTCTISQELVAIDPTSIPPGSTVDYLGRHVNVLKNGSVSRCLPRATPAIMEEMDMVTGKGIGMGNIDISLAVGDNVRNNGSSFGSVTGNKNGDTRPIFVPIPKISDIGLIDSPLVTGITAFDALTPIGKGQNMLVIGQEDPVPTNKRSWMIDLLSFVVKNNRKRHQNNDGKSMRCFYGVTPADGTVRSDVLSRLEQANIKDELVTVVSSRDASVSSSSTSSANEAISTSKTLEAAEALAIAATTCSLAEQHALTTGGDSLVIIDDITLHKSLWDITTQFLVQIYGVDAVVKADLQGGSSSEMRGYFSGLIQRAARFNTKKGGGSVTLLLLSTLPGEQGDIDEEEVFEACDFDDMSEKIKTRIQTLLRAKVPLTPTNLRKIQIPLPHSSHDTQRLALQHVEDLISMSDGQIWLDDQLVSQGRCPPLDPTRSMTRVGVGKDTRTCRADAPALRTVVGSLRFEFQQALDVMDSPRSTTNKKTNDAGNSDGNAKMKVTSSSADESMRRQVRRRDSFLLAMHQSPGKLRSLSQECILLLAASKGHLDQVIDNGSRAGTTDGEKIVNDLLQYVGTRAEEVVSEIEETLDMSVKGRETLEELILDFFTKND